MKRGEVWWVDFDPSFGSETQKIRPAVIISNDASNAVLSRVVVVPFTSNISKVYTCNVVVDVGDTSSKLMADQIMIVDKKRLKKGIGVLSFDDMIKVEDTDRLHLGL